LLGTTLQVSDSDFGVVAEPFLKPTLTLIPIRSSARIVSIFPAKSLN
jgi:hypothetical protein